MNFEPEQIYFVLHEDSELDDDYNKFSEFGFYTGQELIDYSNISEDEQEMLEALVIKPISDYEILTIRKFLNVEGVFVIDSEL